MGKGWNKREKERERGREREREKKPVVPHRREMRDLKVGGK